MKDLNKYKKQKRLYKADLKRYGIYLCILFPVLLAVSCVFSYAKMDNKVSLALVVVIGIALCGLFELVYFLSLGRKEKQNLENPKPKPKDPYAE